MTRSPQKSAFTELIDLVLDICAAFLLLVWDMLEELGTKVSSAELKETEGILSYMRRRILLFLSLLTLVLVLSVTLASLGKRIAQAGKVPAAAMLSGISPVGALLTVRSGVDSWAPMLAALHQIEEHPEGSVYQVVFFDRHIKFQYPLTSLLPLWAANKIGLSDDGILVSLRIAEWIAVCLMAGVSAYISGILLKIYSRDNHPRWLNIAAVIGVLVACVLFYPFMRGYELGQAQTFLSLGFAIAILEWMRGKYVVSGVILGMLTLVKPQYGVILLWMLLRKKTNAAAAFLTCACAGLAVSLIVFGWHQNLEYVKVLQSISRQGESFYANQSVNGLLHRFLGNGTLLFEERNFAPFSRTVYFGTLITSVCILAGALFVPRRLSWGTTTDFACIGLAATMASPVAWDHHYGILFPIFIWLFFGPESLRNSSLRLFALGAAYVLASSCLSITNLYAGAPVLNILQSYLFFAALVVFALLVSSSGDESVIPRRNSQAPMGVTVEPRRSV